MALTVDDGAIPEADEVLEKLRAGDAGQLARVAREHAPRMLASARRIVADDRAAGEAVCAAFAEAERSGWHMSGDALGAALRQLAMSAALGELRERCGLAEAALEELLPCFLPDGHRAVPRRDWSGAEDAVGRPGLAAEVGRALSRLPESHRAVLVLCDVEGLSPGAAATALGLDVEETRRRLHRGRQALRALLASRLAEGSS